MIFRVILESIKQATRQLTGNKLRTFLSLLGITIGIWCIISILSAVDSMKANISDSFNKLGDDVIYVSTMPWDEDPSENWWKYVKRPEPDYKDFKAIKKKVKSAEMASFASFIGMQTLEFQSRNVSNVFLIGITYDYGFVFDVEFDKGRYFSPTEYNNGNNQVILGYKVAEQLFGEQIDPIGRKVKFMGKKMQIIGVIKKEGNNLLNPVNFDECALISYNNARKMANVENLGSSINVKAEEGVGLDQLKDDVKGVLRSSRKLKPRQEDNFSLNQLSMLTKILGSIFTTLNLTGGIIGFFSILVGGFSVANIMFVSVKERTNIIGIKKALGAKKYVILLEFLIEALFLCFIGGLFGLLLVYLSALLATSLLDFKFILSFKNISLGLILSVIIGFFSGIIPAVIASQMDPVEAIRQ